MEGYAVARALFPIDVLMCTARSCVDMMERRGKKGNSVSSLLKSRAQYVHFGFLQNGARWVGGLTRDS